MQKIALLCDKCGGKLTFDGGLKAKCEFCTLEYAMVPGKGEVLRPVSFRALPASGKMNVPLKIAIGKMLKEKTDLIVFSEWSMGELFFNPGGQVRMRECLIPNDFEALIVAKGNHIEMEPEKEGPFAWLGFYNKPLFQSPTLNNLMEIRIGEVSVKGQLVGHSVRIKVFEPESEEVANMICKLIMDNFGVAPDCNLYSG